MNPAPLLIRWFLLLAGSWAVTMPWKTIYALPEHVNNARLQRHENVHVAQIERDGAVRWTFKAIWYLMRYGYRNSPYEIEARKAE